MLEGLRDFFKKSKTPGEVEMCVVAGLQSWFLVHEPPAIETLVPQASRQLRQAYQEQSQIGWRHFIQGRLSSNWAQFINFEIRMKKREGHKNKVRFKTAGSWGTKLILIQWTHIIKFREVRNKTFQAKYTEKGGTREHGIMKAKVFYDMEALRDIQENDPEHAQQTQAKIDNMHPLSLKVFVNNMAKKKRWIKGKTLQEIDQKTLN